MVQGKQMNEEKIKKEYHYIENYFIFLDNKKAGCSIEFDYDLLICQSCDIFQYCYGLYKKEPILKVGGLMV